MKSYHPSELPPRWLKIFGLRRLCTVPGCLKTLWCRGLCQMHLRRLKDHGAVGTPGEREIHENGQRRELPNGYIVVKATRHPLAIKGWVKEHRLVLWAMLGPGSHPCHWCGSTVTWGIDLDVDHLDGNRQNNHPSNLKPACRSCNVRRGMAGNPSDWTPEERTAA